MFRVPTSAFRVGRDSVNQQVDLLAIAAHRDDAELTCGGTLAKVARAGQRVGILDLTQGEMGTRGPGPPKRSGPPKHWACTCGATPSSGTRTFKTMSRRVRKSSNSFVNCD